MKHTEIRRVSAYFTTEKGGLVKTKSVSSIKGLKNVVSIFGFFGVLSGIAIDSVVGFFAACILWWIATKLINGAWEYAGSDTYIMDGSSVYHRIEEACYVSRKDLPKGFEIIRVRGQVVGAFDLFVINLTHGGFIIPLSIKIVCEVEQTSEGVGNYCRYFKWGKQTPAEYLHESFKRFQKENPPPAGVFGDAYSMQMGSPEWIEITLRPQLGKFLTADLKTHGLQMKNIEISSKERKKTILLERKGGLRDDTR